VPALLFAFASLLEQVILEEAAREEQDLTATALWATAIALQQVTKRNHRPAVATPHVAQLLAPAQESATGVAQAQPQSTATPLPLNRNTLAQVSVVIQVYARKPTATLAELGEALGVGLSRAGEIRRLAVQTGYLRADGKRRFVPNGCIPQTQEVQRLDGGGEP
jgi:hypothetical protein